MKQIFTGPTKGFILSLLVLIQSSSLYAQKGNGSLLQIGKPCPDFKLTDIHYYDKKTVSLQDLKGKWFALDFWNRYCSACVASFSKTNSLQKRFSDKLQFLLVGYNGSQYTGKSDNIAIRVLYDRIQRKENLAVPVAYDSVLFKKFDIGPCPYIVLVDGLGIIRAITYSLNDTLIEAFLKEEHPEVPYAMNREEINKVNANYNIDIPYLVDNNGGKDSAFIYRSLLSNWTPEKPKSLPITIDALATWRKFEVLGADISSLYMYAYIGKGKILFRDSLYGRAWSTPIWTNFDSSEFLPNYVSGKNVYCYSLSLPAVKANKGAFMKAMQKDLANYFGYKIRAEIRDMPYWKLTVDTIKMKTLLSRNRKFSYEDHGTPQMGFSASNYPIAYLLEKLQSYNPQEPPFIDSTGIKGNIDITLNALMTNLNEVRNALRKEGLYLSKSAKAMTVMVIHN